MANNNNISRAELDSYIFSRSIHMQLILQGMLKAAGGLNGKRCLAIGSSNAMLSLQLRKAGGNWNEIVFDEDSAAGIRELTGDSDIRIFQDNAPLPFENKSFDIIVIISGLTDHGSDYDFVEKCHKLIDSDGHLILCVPRAKKISLIGPLRSLLGVSEEVHTERKLFDLLKNGFDVMQMRSLSRFFMEFVDTFARAAALRRRNRGGAGLIGVYRLAYPFYFLAYQLDVLIFFTKGHRLIAVAKRHSWRTRQAPILSDGRTISEAVLKPLTD